MKLSLTQDTSLGMSTMILINLDGSDQGPFRVATTGSQLVSRITRIGRLIPEISPNLACLYISYYCNRATSSLATPWLDIENLL
jgi:hypothetical protein